MKQWTNLVRFISGGKVYYGNAPDSFKEAQTIIGNPFGISYSFGKTLPIEHILSPISPVDARTIRCLGLNFRKHAAETGMPVPKYPVVFHKPSTALNGPNSPIFVPPMAQDGGKVDYETELVVVIGKKCYQATKENALSFVAGYTVGNDVSQRVWQIEKGGGQWNVSKSFDGWAPIGPQIVSTEKITDVSSLRLESYVNGERRQSERLDDLIFSVADAIEFLSAGQTLLPGDLIFMGTPSGVGMGFTPQKWVKDGDVVECSLTGVGKITNKLIFGNPSKL